MCSARAFSLLETLVGAFLLLLLLTVMFQILVPMSKGSVRGAQQSELQQSAVLALDRLTRDLEACPPAGITLGAGDRYACHRLVDVAADGSQMLSTDLVLVWWDRTTGRLWRRVWPPEPPVLGRTPLSNQIFTPTDAELVQLTVQPARLLTANVKEFQLTLAPSQAVLHLVLEKASPDGKPAESYQLDRRVALPNAQY